MSLFVLLVFGCSACGYLDSMLGAFILFFSAPRTDSMKPLISILFWFSFVSVFLSSKRQLFYVYTFTYAFVLIHAYPQAVHITLSPD